MEYSCDLWRFCGSLADLRLQSPRSLDEMGSCAIMGNGGLR